MKQGLTKTAGYSLVELLIAMTLGLILIGGMIAVFSGNKRTSEMTTEMANMQESARFALQAISEDLRAAGFQGCLGLDNGAVRDLTNVSVLNGQSLFDTATTGSVIVDANNWVPPHPSGVPIPINTTPVPGTHTIAMQGGTSDRVPLFEAMNDGTRPSNASDLVTRERLNVGIGSPAIISDCDSADLFTVTNMVSVGLTWRIAHDATSNTTSAFQQAYGNFGKLDQVSITPWFSNIYFIGDTGIVTENGDPVRALYQQSYPFDQITNPPTELIQGIENMRIAFGIQNGRGEVRYVQANDAAFDPGRVVSVQVGLLMASWDQIATQDDTNTYVLAGQPIPAATNVVDGNFHEQDKRYRLAFNTTVKVRNRRVQSQ